MVYARHSSRHKHLLPHRQQAEEEATAVHKQRVANKTDYQAVADVLCVCDLLIFLHRHS